MRFHGGCKDTYLIMRSSCGVKNGWIDLPKLKTLCTDEKGLTFSFPKIVTIKGSSTLPY